MDVVVKSRHCNVSDQFRLYVDEKITRLEKHDDRVIRVEVEVSAERNKRQHDQASRVEITVLSKGPVIRAESNAEDKTAAFDLALDKLMAQLRKAADRKRVHRGSRTPRSLHEAAAELPLAPEDGASLNDASLNGSSLNRAQTEGDPAANGFHMVAGMEVKGEGPMVVREKIHPAEPISLDQALMAMELVGHDFFLFIDSERLVPSVVYRRKAYDYGVIRLETSLVDIQAS